MKASWLSQSFPLAHVRMGEGWGEGELGCEVVVDKSNHPDPNPLPDYRARGPEKRMRAFTLIEVLATMMLMAIVLPAAMQGIALATSAASTTRHRTEASGLASSKLSEIIANGQWQGGILSGDFGTDAPGYTWKATVGNWSQDTSSANLQQVDLTVFWIARNRQQSVTVSTLTYVRPTSTQ